LSIQSRDTCPAIPTRGKFRDSYGLLCVWECWIVGGSLFAHGLLREISRRPHLTDLDADWSFSFLCRYFDWRYRVSAVGLVLLHTWTVTKELFFQAIHEKQSMDLNVCIDDQGHPYLGHPKEYHEKTHEPFFDSMPLWEAVEALADSNIPVIVDCKHFGAWPVVEDVLKRLRPERCLVHSFVSELKFEAGRMPGEPDFLSEWPSIERLQAMKREFASITTTASAKWLPTGVLVSEKYEGLLEGIVTLLREYAVDTVCLNVSDSTLSDKALRRFLQDDILATSALIASM